MEMAYLFLLCHLLILICVTSAAEIADDSKSIGIEDDRQLISNNQIQTDNIDDENRIIPRRRNCISLFSGSASDYTPASRLFPSLPLPKPVPSVESRTGDDFGEERENYEDLISQIPDSFIVTESSGTYSKQNYDSTSADSMKKRAILYRLLSIIYIFFDSFDLDGFRDFLRETPAALKHQNLRYNLIENLFHRSAKTENKDTLRILSQFVELLDFSSTIKTVGPSEYESFTNFEMLLTSNEYPSGMISRETILLNEKRRLNPLHDAISAGDYESVKRIIQESNRSIWMTIFDFLLLLECPCCNARFAFLSWALEHGHMNVNEKYSYSKEQEQLLTPLMLAAMHPRWSNDIVKAILEHAPTSISETDSSGNKAVHYAQKNDKLQKQYRKPLIKMLKLKCPTTASLDTILHKYNPR